MVKEKACDVIVVDREDHVDLLVLDPSADLVEAIEDGLPRRIVLLASVFCVADGGECEAPMPPTMRAM